MTLPNFTVGFDTPSAYTPTDYVLELSISAGRQSALDTYGASNGEIVIRRVSANSSNLDEIVPGVGLAIQSKSVGYTTGTFYVTDVFNEYAIASAADVCRITFEGSLALANRAYLNNYNLSSGTISSQIGDVATQSGLTITIETEINSDVDGTTVTSVADWLQKLVTTVNGRIDDTLDIIFYDKYIYGQFLDYINGNAPVFTDGTIALSAGQIAVSYDELTYSSLAENYYTRVIIDPDSHAAQVSTLAGASSPYRVLQLDTFNYSTSQAKDYADFLLSTYSDPTHKRISSLSVNGAGTNGVYMLRNLFGYAIGKTAIINFRGTAYNATIEGWTYTATPEVDRTTFFFSGADLNNYLILDDADRGVLDANRLGY